MALVLLPGCCHFCAQSAGYLGVLFPPSRPLQDHERTRWQQTRDIDIVGLALYTGGLTTFLVGLQSAGQEANGWQSTKVIALLVAGLVALVGCFLYDFLVASNPVFPYRIFRQLRDVTLLLAVAFLAGLVYYTMSALYPQGSLYMYTTDATPIGLIALPNGVAQFVFGAIAPALISKIKHLKLQLLSALVLQTVFVALGAIAFPNRAAWSAFQVFAIGPFAFITVLCYVITGLNVPLRYLGLASGLVGTFRSMGGAVGNAVFNTILNSSFSARVGPSVAAAAAAHGFDMSRVGELIRAAIANASGAPYAFEGIQGVTVTPDLQAAAALAVKEAYVHAYRIVFLATIPFGVVTVVGACFIRDPSKYLTNHTAVQMEKKW
ncbi:fungal trichothecene efflux pump [Aspergillus keveii]|uniref:Fungal trichothecene efflux pump n=1 Tax=Aspergillus keveii TaxID=714993 RepID=A0ABR4FJQ1_9EURO